MLPKFSVNKPYTIMVSVIIIIVLGFVSFTKLSTDLFPKMDLPYTVIITTFPGANPEKVETSVTKPIEQTIGTVSNVKNITSTSSESSSMIMVEFAENTNMDSALIELNNRLDIIKGSLPDEVSSPTIIKINPDLMPVMVTAIDVDNKTPKEISEFVSSKILPNLEKINGVASVTSSGLVDEKIKISLNQEKIDNINSQVLENVDSELSKTQNDLNTAKKNLEEGKSTFEKQSKDQTRKIVDGQYAIKEGKQQIEKAESDLISQESLLLDSKKLLELSYNKFLEQENTLKKQIEKLTSIENRSLADEAVLKNLNATLSYLQEPKYDAYYKLKEMDNALAQISASKNELTNKKNELQDQEKNLEVAKVNLSTELAKASTNIQSSQAELEKGQTEFENARDKAYKNASIEGIITQDMISKILTAENFEMPAGSIINGNNKLSVKVGEKFTNIDDIKNLTLFSFDIPGLENVTLEQLADISFSNNTDEIYAKVNGNNAILATFQKQSTSSTTNVSKDIKSTISEIEKEYPNVHFTNLMDQGVYIDIVIGSVLENLLYGGILAVIVLFLFLRDVKPTIIVALSIPISLTFAITLMYFTGVTINIISLSGLALGVGMLVDNSIVVVENIYRLRSNGKSAKESAMYGASSVAGAIFASTLTTICVFLPIVFAEGISKQLFTDMGLTIAYSLLASLIVALTLVPTMSSTVFKNTKNKEHNIFNKFSALYEKILRIALKFKALVLISAVGVLIISIIWATSMGTQFIPEADSTQMSLTLNMPKESTFEELKSTSNSVINKLLSIDDIKNIGAIESSSVGLMNMSGSQNKSTNMYIILKEDKKLNNIEIKEKILQLTKDLNCEIEVSTSNMDMSALSGSGIQVAIKGNDIEKLQSISNDITAIMNETEGLTDVDNGIAKTDKELKIVVDKNKAMKYGITVATVFQTVATSVLNEQTSTEITLDSKDYPVVVVKSEKNKINEENIGNIEIDGKENQTDVKVKLQDLANIIDSNTLSSISHDNNQRYIKASATVDSEHNIGLVSRAFEEKLNNYEVPNGYSVEIEGESETINTTLTDLFKMIALAVLFIYLIMVAQFQSFLSPFIIMFTIPLAFTGGLLALGLTGTEISIIAMIGFLVLSGIVVNNGIVLIDYINQLRKSGMNKKEAIVEAGKTRLRPILMTALTTILGLFTLALGIGSGAEMLQSLGIVTIGGLSYATILTLVVVPCLYDIMNRKKDIL